MASNNAAAAIVLGLYKTQSGAPRLSFLLETFSIITATLLLTHLWYNSIHALRIDASETLNINGKKKKMDQFSESFATAIPSYLKFDFEISLNLCEDVQLRDQSTKYLIQESRYVIKIPSISGILSNLPLIVSCRF